MFNKVILMGRITHDLEPKTMSNGEMFLPFSIAVDRSYGKGEERETDFFNCTAFRKTAEFINTYFGKGRMIMVEGRLQNDVYVDKNGATVKANKIIVENVQFTGEKKPDGQPQTNTTYQQSALVQQQPQQPLQYPQQPMPQQMYQQPVMPQQAYPQGAYSNVPPQQYTQPQQTITSAAVSAATDDYPF